MLLLHDANRPVEQRIVRELILGAHAPPGAEGAPGGASGSMRVHPLGAVKGPFGDLAAFRIS